MCVVFVGLPTTVSVGKPSPQLIVQRWIVSAPGSDDDRFSVYAAASRTLDAPLIRNVGTTLLTITGNVFAAYVPSSSVAVARIVRITLPSANVCVTLAGWPLTVCVGVLSPQL